VNIVADHSGTGHSAALNADMHCHSTVSDGLLSPVEVVRRAHGNGVELLALTDHDGLGGLAAARQEADALGLSFVNGVEISVSWGDDTTVHVIGLNVAADHPNLIAGLAQVRQGRDERAMMMAAELDKVGIHDAYQGALKYVSNPALVSRAHFARHIVSQGHAKDVHAVFDTWLAKGKPGYVEHSWATLAQAVSWIREAGGIAVIAHPKRYRISARQLRKLITEFKGLGGAGIEVISGGNSPDEVRELARYAREFDLAASRASDFHGPGESFVDLGRMPPLPTDLTPVWQLF
jgi:predicted metal-dependent phosphoesterase TrpH